MKRPLVPILLALLMLGIVVARYARRQLAPALSPEISILDFYQAVGIDQEQFARFLDQSSNRGSYPVLIRLRNDHGDCLVDDRVVVRWKDGEYRLLIGKSGVLRFSLGSENLPGLSLVVPRGYERVEQSTIPLGPHYRAEEDVDATDWIGEVVYDGEILNNLVQSSGDVVSYERWREQLRRTRPARAIELPEPVPFSQGLSPAEIYDRHRRSVVVIGQLYRDGTVTHAGGVVLTATGVIATAYHVLDKSSEIVSRGVRLSDGSVHPIVEVLVADQSEDIALLRIAADGLDFCPLSPGDVTGTPVTIISHPSGRFFTLSHGHISRYAAVVLYGRSTIKMSVTAEFADGSSGAPVFNPQGAVAGLVSSTEPAGNQMVFRSVVPAQTIRRMLGRE